MHSALQSTVLTLCSASMETSRRPLQRHPLRAQANPSVLSYSYRMVNTTSPRSPVTNMAKRLSVVPTFPLLGNRQTRLLSGTRPIPRASAPRQRFTSRATRTCTCRISPCKTEVLSAQRTPHDKSPCSKMRATSSSTRTYAS